jgi:hypothetical protein
MVRFIALLLIVSVINLLFVTFQVAVFRVMRFSVEQIGIGIPVVLKRRVRGTELRVGLLPTLAYVGSTDWSKASRAKRALTVVAPWLVIGLIPPLLMDPARALRHEFLVWPRLLEGALDTERAHELIRALWTLSSTRPTEAASVVIATVLALNLSPVPGLAGGHVVAALLGQEPRKSIAAVVGVLAWTVWFLLLVSWLLKFGAFVLR